MLLVDFRLTNYKTKNCLSFPGATSVFAERRNKSDVNPNKRKILDFSVMKEEISQNNVLKMAELIVFMELRFQIGYLGSSAQKMYADLYADIKHKNELGYTFSDLYDLVQEGALYLC